MLAMSTYKPIISMQTFLSALYIFLLKNYQKYLTRFSQTVSQSLQMYVLLNLDKIFWKRGNNVFKYLIKTRFP